MSFLALLLSLPTRSATVRVRLWRAFRTLGCATVRDGVYLLPDRPDLGGRLDTLAAEVNAAGGRAEVYRLAGRDREQEARLRALFDRNADYAALLTEIGVLRERLRTEPAAASVRAVRVLRRRFDELVAIDYFPGPQQVQARRLLDELDAELARRLTPDEPYSVEARIARLDRAHYQGRLWATRRDLWVDRVACAWLIRRHIDHKARFLWLASPAECPPEALGFDFDGAVFTHVGARVSFETLLAAFGLEADAALRRLGAVVHALDVGGITPPEAVGLDALLRGMKALAGGDDDFLERAGPLFDALYSHFRAEPMP
ncbi:MAG: chromate resistance protein [Burkholderiales bacterium]|nr:chromate resistance protein [Burkholderiales bacterium]